MKKSDSLSNHSISMKTATILRFTFAGILLAGMTPSIPLLRADDDGGGCSSCGDGSKKVCTPSATPAPSPASTNAPAKN